jgi:hypothetical protein
MLKLKETRSRFFDPLIKWLDGVYLVSPATYAEAFNMEIDQVLQQCEDKVIPFAWDGESILIPMDDRDVAKGGMGGKFTEPSFPYREILFIQWRGRRAR